MGASKSDHFSEAHNQMAQMAKALAHPARIAILEYILSVEACICGDIVNELPLAQATISQHLKELKSAGLIKGNIEGNSICYCLDEEGIARLGQYFHSISKKLAEKKSNCC